MAVDPGIKASSSGAPADERKKNLLVFLLFLFVLLLVYFPCVTGYYVHHDDYFIWAYEKEKSLSAHPTFDIVMQLGRPITNLILTAKERMVSCLSDANTVRAVSILELSILLLLLFFWLRSSSLQDRDCLVLCLLIGTLPAFQVYVSYLACCSDIYAAIFSLISIMLLRKGLSSGRRILNILTVTALIFFLMGLFTYQPAAMFFWPAAAVPILFCEPDKWRENRGAFRRYLTFGILAIIIYFMLYKIFYLKIIEPVRVEELYSGGLIAPTEILSQIIWFVKEPLINALNLWNIFPSTPLTVLVIFVLAFGVYGDITAIHKAADPESKRRLASSFYEKWLLIACLLPLSYSANLVGKTHMPFYRTTAALGALIGILFYRGFLEMGRLIRIDSRPNMLLCIACVISLFSCQRNMQDFAFAQSMEIRYVKNQLIENMDKLARNDPIYVIPFERDSQYGKQARYDEFHALSSSYPADIPLMVECALSEIGVRDRLVRYESGRSSAAGAGDSMILIDMNKVSYYLSGGSCSESPSDPVMSLCDSRSPPVIIRTGAGIILGTGPGPEDLSLLERGYKGFDIARLGGIFLAFPQGEGGFDLERVWKNGYSRSFIGDSREEVKRKIDCTTIADSEVETIMKAVRMSNHGLKSFSADFYLRIEAHCGVVSYTPELAGKYIFDSPDDGTLIFSKAPAMLRKSPQKISLQSMDLRAFDNSVRTERGGADGECYVIEMVPRSRRGDLIKKVIGVDRKSAQIRRIDYSYRNSGTLRVQFDYSSIEGFSLYDQVRVDFNFPSSFIKGSATMRFYGYKIVHT
jgi:outer membrane lipoprotein-sorting protein